MSRISNRAVICEKLLEYAKKDSQICIVTSDSRGSASLTPFANQYPDRIIEVGIAEQNLVGVSAGLAYAGLKPYAASPACFLTMRSIEQIKVDVAYSKTNVKLIGISAGVSYGALGMTHHSLQDIAVLAAIPNMTIIAPADRYETAKMMDVLQKFEGPVYIRVSRNPVDDVYSHTDFDYQIGKANILKQGDDITLIAYGDMVNVIDKAGQILETQGIHARVINMHTIKPLDKEVIIKAANETKGIIVVEEHSIYNGLGSLVSQIVCANHPCPVKTVALTGEAQELFDHYDLTKENIACMAKEMLED